MKAKLHFALGVAWLATFNTPLSTWAQGTAFTYQGRLTENGAAASGSNDLTFTLYDAASDGATVGASNVVNDLAVTNGLFTVALDFGAAFDGSARWLQIAVRPGASAGAYTNLAPRQPITATPYALQAATVTGVVPAGQISGTLPLAQLPAPVVTNGANGVNLSGTFSGNGAGVTNVDAITLDGLTSSSFWRTGGNAGTLPGTHFLGTTDNQPLDFRVNNQRGLRLEPTAITDTVNVIGGSARNFVGAGVSGATIGGGGSGDYFGFALTNQVEADYGTVAGGGRNAIQPGATFGTIGGGQRNTIHASAYNSTIGGGDQNTIQTSAQYAAISGGQQNTIHASAYNSTIGGGDQNTIQTSAQYAAISGGQGNTIRTNKSFATIGGGYLNIADGAYATVPGGAGNTAAGQFSFAAGHDAKALHDGAFVWADSPAGGFSSTGNDQFCIRARGGLQLDSLTSQYFGSQLRQMLNLYGTNYGIGVQSSSLYFRCDNAAGTDGFIWYKGGVHNDGYAQPGAGGTELMHLVQGALYVNGALVPSSDRNLKENFSAVSPREVLDKVAAMPISRWNFKGDAATPHVGPMAQDFHAAFGLGTDDKHIATVDADGVALAAIQGLNRKLEDRSQNSEARIEKLESQNAELKQAVAELKALVAKLAEE